MTDYILIEGDQAIFQPTFGAAIVAPLPGTLKASGPGTLGGKKLCVAGDEGEVAVPGCEYHTPLFSKPGTGTLKIAALAQDQKARRTRTGGKAVLLEGTTFTAKLEVQVPATMPNSSPDPMKQYAGTGKFVTTNRKFRGA